MTVTVALPHIVFLTILYIGGLILWKLNADTKDTPLLIGQAVIVGGVGGVLIGAFT